MKKIILLPIIFIGILGSLAACGKQEVKNREEVTAIEKQSTELNVEEEKTEQNSETVISELPTGHVANEVKIGYVDVTGSGKLSDILGVARDQGIFDEEFGAIGVTANLIPMTGAGPAINEALASGDLDIGSLGDVPAILGRAAKIDTKIISFSGLNSGASLIAGKDTEYQSIADLKGKKIATQRGAFMHRVLVTMLESAGMTVDDIEFVNVNAQTAAEMLVTGNVDGIVVGGVTLTRLEEEGYKILIDHRETSDFKSGGYTLARTAFIEENPDIIKAYIRAIARARQLAIDDKDTLLRQWESTEESRESYEYLYPKHNNYPDIKATEETIKNGKDVLKFLLDNELIEQENEFEFESWIDSRFYEVVFTELGIQ